MNYFGSGQQATTGAPANSVPAARGRTPRVNVIAGSVGYNCQQLTSMALGSDFISDLKKNIDQKMELLEKEKKPAWALKRQSPPVISLAVETLIDQFKIQRSKL